MFRCPDLEKSAYDAYDKYLYKPKHYYDERIDAKQYQSNNNADCKSSSMSRWICSQNKSCTVFGLTRLVLLPIKVLAVNSLRLDFSLTISANSSLALSAISLLRYS